MLQTLLRLGRYTAVLATMLVLPSGCESRLSRDEAELQKKVQRDVQNRLLPLAQRHNLELGKKHPPMRPGNAKFHISPGGWTMRDTAGRIVRIDLTGCRVDEALLRDLAKLPALKY